MPHRSLLPLAIIVTALLLPSAPAAQPPATEPSPCFDAVNWELSPDDTVDVYTLGGAVTRGIYPITLISASLLKISPLGPDGVGDGRPSISIPLADIDRVTCRRRSGFRPFLMVFGTLAGMAGGAAAGVALAPEPEGWMDMPELTYGMLGMTVGGVIGAITTGQLSKNMRSTRTFRCR